MSYDNTTQPISEFDRGARSERHRIISILERTELTGNARDRAAAKRFRDTVIAAIRV